jgi:hypothetical protein
MPGGDEPVADLEEQEDRLPVSGRRVRAENGE